LPVLDLLDTLRTQQHDGFVFPGTVEGTALVGFPKLWKKLFKDTALADVKPHVLRHSFTSIANDLGFTEATIGTLVGHSRDSVTGRYIHTVDALLVMAADTVAGFIKGLLGGGDVPPDVLCARSRLSRSCARPIVRAVGYAGRRRYDERMAA